MTNRETLLVELVAATDAVWAALRKPDWAIANSCANFYFARRDFGSLGMRWISGGATAEDRRQQTRRLETLVADGLAIRGGSERKTRARLTPRGDEVARHLLGLPGAEGALATIGEIVRIGSKAVGGVSACELQLARLAHYQDSDACRRELECVEHLVAAALWRGWVVSDSTSAGCAWYCVTPAGKAALRAGVPDLGEMPGPCNGAWDVYCDAYQEARQFLRTADREDTREVGLIPLPGDLRKGWNPSSVSTPS